MEYDWDDWFEAQDVLKELKEEMDRAEWDDEFFFEEEEPD